MSDNWKQRSEGMKCRTCMWFVPKFLAGPPPGLPSSIEAGLPPHPYEPTGMSGPHSTALDPRGPIGRCRRHAPTMNGYPVVFASDWCGDHKLDENAL